MKDAQEYLEKQLEAQRKLDEAASLLRQAAAFMYSNSHRNQANTLADMAEDLSMWVGM